jgi:hypothetical protein
MGERGCVVPPEHRPFCTGYVCAPHLADRTFRRKYERLCTEAGVPPNQRQFNRRAEAMALEAMKKDF